MRVEIIALGRINTAKIICSKPQIIQLVKSEPLQVIVAVNKDGLSAYQIAVKNGEFVGTEAEFAAAILPDFTILGNYERDWANDFLIALNT